MTDDRFYERAGPFTLADIAARIGAEPEKGASDIKLRDVAALESAEPGDISLFSDSKYANAFAVTKASLVITSDKLAKLPHGVTLLVVPNPRLAFAQVGHNVRIGHHSLLVAQVGIGGSTSVGPMVLIGGQVGISDHLTIGAGARLAARSGVTRDISAGERVGGYPARPLKRWHRETALLAKMAKPQKTDEQEQAE